VQGARGIKWKVFATIGMSKIKNYWLYLFLRYFRWFMVCFTCISWYYFRHVF
jgi:hypothetical protein